MTGSPRSPTTPPQSDPYLTPSLDQVRGDVLRRESADRRRREAESVHVAARVTAPPRFATRRSPDLPTEGQAVARVGQALGTPLLPWQRQVVDVAGERTPDGRYRYPVVVLTVPRQTGKTVLLRCLGVHRASVRRRASVFYTAQTGKDARKRWEDMVAAVEDSPLGDLVDKSLRAGQEALIFPNGSRFGVFAPKRDALHGETPPLVMLDEAWKHAPELGEALMGAIRPAQITLRDRQLWIVSTAGDVDSAWFRAWVEAGRAAVSDPAAQIAHFEWSAPDDAPRDDPATWWAMHPALGHLITEDDLRENLTLADFDRAYLNRWPSLASASVIPMPTFRAGAVGVGRPTRGDVALGIEVGPDRADAAILAAWRGEAGAMRLAVIEHAPGASWLHHRVPELVDQWDPVGVGADDRGPAGPDVDRLRAAGVEVESIGADYPTACGSLLAGIVDHGVVHDGSAPLMTAAEHATRRTVGDRWVWDRRLTTESITPLPAATIAAWMFDHPSRVPDVPFRVVA